jgi:hypothetical protein
MTRRTLWLGPSLAALGAALGLVAWHLAVVLPPHEDDRAAELLEGAGNARVYRVSRLTPGAFFGGFSEKPGDITGVFFSNGPVTREQMATVSGLRWCGSVSFRNVSFQDPSGLELLGVMLRLTILDFTHNAVSDEVLTRHLTRLPGVHSLGLQDNPLTDRCIEAVAGLPALLRVYVHGTRITLDGVVRLRQLRPKVEVDTTTPAYP